MKRESEPTHQELHELLLNHVILPRYLPQSKSRDLHNEELQLMKLMVENVEELSEMKMIPCNTIKMLSGLKREQSPDCSKVIANEIGQLKPGESFAMFVRRQNCALIIHMPKNTDRNQSDRIIVATFPGNLHPKHVYDSDSDIEFNYPAEAVNVPFSEMIRSVEFAKQLCFLYRDLPIDERNRNYVSKWLVTLLADASSGTVNPDTFPIITKKKRDEMLGEDNSNFFRRSSYYMCTKVFLQHSLTLELGPKQGKVLYKLIMLQFITKIIDFFNYEMCEQLNIELINQALAKLARRIEKMTNLMQHEHSEPFNQLYDHIVNVAKETIANIRQKINKQIKRLHEDEEEKARITPLVNLDFEADIIQKIPKLLEYLEARKSERIPKRFGSGLQIKPIMRHYIHNTKPPTGQIATLGQIANEIPCNLMLSDFENWILYVLKISENSYGSDEIRTWSFAYAKCAEQFYKNDQLGMSRMILVRLKMIAMLDSIAFKTQKFFKDHRTGINPSIIDSLLMPHHQDMIIALDIEKYFKLRNEAAKHPSLIEEDAVTINSFSARFAAQNSKMQEILGKIEKIEIECIEAKRIEWQDGRLKVAQLRAQKPLICSYYTDYHGIERHDRYCQRCQIQIRIDAIKIQQYEKPLPKIVYEQNAVVFELNIPIEIASLRDVLCEFTIFSSEKTNRGNAPQSNWIHYAQITKFNESKSKLVQLGSTTQGKLVPYHVDSSFDRFIIENGYNCLYHAAHEWLPSPISETIIKDKCTLTTNDKNDKNIEYANLQWTLYGTKHTQNEVIARQYECHDNLSLAEFKKFGSLRADGHRLQLRNIYAAIETEALSFEKPSVLSLIIQALWEAGVSGDGHAIRESHIDFSEKFAEEMIELLDKFIDLQKDNWTNPLKLLMTSFIAVRVFELNKDSNFVDRIVKLLNKIRNIAFDWIEKIETAINGIVDPNPTDEQKLRMNLVFVAIAGAVTFSVHFTHPYFKRIFVDNGPKHYSISRVWLHFIITLNNNVLLNSKLTNLPLNLRMFLRFVRNTGIHIESTIQSMIKQQSFDVYSLVKQQWTRANEAHFQRFYFHEKFPQILVIEVSLKSHISNVTIDIVTGNFLVNNLPVARLPNNITKTVQFSRIFENFIFEVQPDAQHSFAAIHSYNECNYEFSRISNNTIIIEKSIEIEKELIPHEILIGEIPHQLIEMYSHFWNKCDDTIEFRPKLFSDEHFSNEIGIEYRLDLEQKLLKHLKTDRFMLDINSDSYLKIAKQLARLESSKFIHVLIAMDKMHIAKAELIRMNLKFIIDCGSRHEKCDLISNEYNQMRVAYEQNCGTLYGLQHGLLLESLPSETDSIKTTTKLLLIPHAEVHTTNSGAHVSAEIDIESVNMESDAQKTTHHVYQVDDFCRQLKANSNNYTAWFYLAYLHAVTSYGDVEPFTKMTGTERALQILQSGFAWSSSPYNKESSKILHMIEHLSPMRTVNESWQRVVWPTHIPPHSAQDSFIFIARKLLSDSQRLHGLHDEKIHDCQLLEIDTELRHNCRQYLHCLPLSPNVKVSEVFIHHEKMKTSTIEPFHIKMCTNTQTVSILYHRQSYRVQNEMSLKDFLMSKEELDGTVNMEMIPNILKHQVYQSFENLWIPLYEYARGEKMNNEEFALIWSLLTHEEKSFLPILALQAIAMNPQIFSAINPPPVQKFILREGTYSANRVTSILEDYHQVPVDYHEQNFNKIAYKQSITNAINQLTSVVTAKWPCDEINLKPYCSNDNINAAAASVAISRHLKIWNNNRKLVEFITQVENALNLLNNSCHVPLPLIHSLPAQNPGKWSKFEIDFNQKMSENVNELEKVEQEAHDIWRNKANVMKSADEWWLIYEKIINGPGSRHLINAGMFPRSVPTLVLPEIATNGNNPLKDVIGALAITIAHEQRDKRIQIYSQQDQFRVALENEENNRPHMNWNPSQRPEWLLFEIEQNLTIRSVQVDVANHMMNPTNNTHSVMQLNMGEGKTAVIAPIIAAVLSNGYQACQITVLKSLFATNLKSYRRYLGGMLNRRIYEFPCRRDMKIDKHSDQLLNIYEECKAMRGIILTTPEWRLSFQLKSYELIQKDFSKQAIHLLTVQKWINTNIRSLLDESDAILHAKYQLIYTLGNQLQLDGGPNRWNTIQAVLKRVPYHMKRLNAEHGEEKVEFDQDYMKKYNVYGAEVVEYRSDVFTPCRILDASVYDLLKSYLIEDFLNGEINISIQPISPSLIEDLRYLLSEKDVDKEKFDKILEDFSLKDRNIILTLCGLLRFEVLKLVLMRRRRVNYGVNDKGKMKMAIPFKAKDVAAESTEFGHPDVALCFTYLSYYYSGLSDEQLHRTFEILSNSQNAAATYKEWSESVSSQLIDASIRSYTGVNLSDPQQRNRLFAVYRFNMHVIDFYLSNEVFPRESRTFENKLMCTAWDLCNEHMQHLVTGFSGTNDTKNLLPLPIIQNDLAELESTNEDVRRTLLREENQSYENLPPNVSGREIIEKLVESEIPVLLDSGALILELNNLQVAQMWLEKAPEYSFDAAIYFDEKDVLQTIDRNGIITEFDCSVYRDKLGSCLVYLDDVHTRGTDLKFPSNWKACVTLSGDITRDKTVQACMRMRQLGKDNGHSIAFWASFEADIKIRELCESAISHECTANDHVIEFICENSKKFETENTVHWAAAAYNYTKEIIGHKLHDDSTDQSSLDGLLSKCIENECHKLKDIYGDKREALLIDIVRSKFDKLIDTFKEHATVLPFIRTIKDATHNKILEHAPNVKRFMQALDEEQEKELEKELDREPEQERQIERPAAMTPAIPEFDDKLIDLMLNGVEMNIIADLKGRGTLVSLAKGLSNTQMMQEFSGQSDSFSKHIFITKDCVRVLSDLSCACDEYLRSIWWIALVSDPTKIDAYNLVLLSSFESNRLFTTFKQSQNAVLHMYRSRMSKMHDNLLHQTKLQVTKMVKIPRIDVRDEVQIGVYAGSMFFNSERQQAAYCSFLGLIPQIRTKEQEKAFMMGIIKPNGFVLPEHRNHSTAIRQAVGDCQFNYNPIDLTLKLIKAHHHFVRKESHAASILEKGIKMSIEPNIDSKK